MTTQIVLGADRTGAPVQLDVEELLATRLLVQGNSGSGKSHLLRRILEQSASVVQQVVIDPEGDFVSLAEPFGHVVVDGSAYDGTEIVKLAARIRQHDRQLHRIRAEIGVAQIEPEAVGAEQGQAERQAVRLDLARQVQLARTEERLAGGDALREDTGIAAPPEMHGVDETVLETEPGCPRGEKQG